MIPDRDKLPASVVAHLASRSHRMHHYLWHQVRNAWARYSPPTRDELQVLGWAPPRLHLDHDTNVVVGNHAGEDFLFMHRQMVKLVNGLLSQATKDPQRRISGWARLPEPGDSDYPVPPAYEHPHPMLRDIVLQTKSDEYYEKRMLFWERTFTDASFLRTVSLGVLGSLIESTIHDAMHMRWSSPTPLGIRVDPTLTGSPSSDEVLKIDAKWDDARYDFLGDEYSAHVNPIFWKIHGWVDDRISDWMIANAIKPGFHTDPLSTDPHWLGTWQGVLPTHAHGEHDPSRQRLEDAVLVIHRTGIIHHFYARTVGR